MDSSSIIRFIKDVFNKNNDMMLHLPKSINPQDFRQCVELLFIYAECMMRARAVIILCESSLSRETDPQMKAQFAFHLESSKGYLQNLKQAYSRLRDSILSAYTDTSAEKVIFKVLNQAIIDRL